MIFKISNIIHFSISFVAMLYLVFIYTVVLASQDIWFATLIFLSILNIIVFLTERLLVILE